MQKGHDLSKAHRPGIIIQYEETLKEGTGLMSIMKSRPREGRRSITVISWMCRQEIQHEWTYHQNTKHFGN